MEDEFPRGRELSYSLTPSTSPAHYLSRPNTAENSPFGPRCHIMLSSFFIACTHCHNTRAVRLYLVRSGEESSTSSPPLLHLQGDLHHLKQQP